MVVIALTAARANRARAVVARVQGDGGLVARPTLKGLG